MILYRALFAPLAILLTCRHHVRRVVTGFDEVDLTAEQEAYLETNEPWRVRT